MNENLSNQIQLFKSVFKGREDVFAVRWEKETKSGYMPAYFYDLYMYRAHKIKGGTFQNYKDKIYLKLTDKEIAKYLNGEQLIGIYPLLSDNSSWFLVADFDKENWIAEAKSFIKSCREKVLPAYLWHTDKNKQALINKVKEIDKQLNVIRNKGRQVFLETSPESFTRILHDYSDKKKGFIIWKDLLEEQIV
jgi:hypothetical protein